MARWFAKVTLLSLSPEGTIAPRVTYIENLIWAYKISACAPFYFQFFFSYHWHASRTALRFRRLISRIFLARFARIGVIKPIFRNNE